MRVLVPPAAEALALDQAYGSDLPAGLRVVTVAPWPDLYAALLVTRNWVRGMLRPVRAEAQPPAAMIAPAPAVGGMLRRIAVTIRRLPDEAGRWIVPAAAALRRMLRDEPADLVLTVAPVFSAHVIALRAGLPREGTKWFAWSHDPMVGNPFKSETTDWWHRMIGRWDAEIAARATRLLVTTEALSRDFAARYPSARAPELLPCGYERDEVPPLPPPPTTGPLILSHVGTLYGHRSPLPLLEAVARLLGSGALAADALRLRFVGAEENLAEESLAHAVARLGLETIVSHSPPVPQAEALRVIGTSGAGLLLAERQPLQVPAKTFEYIGLRRPVFALADGATAELIRDSGIGIASDRAQLEQALLGFVAQWQDDALASYRPALDRAAERYDADTLAAGVLALLAKELGTP